MLIASRKGADCERVARELTAIGPGSAEGFAGDVGSAEGVAALSDEIRARTKTLVSLLAPLLILIVGALVGFIVIALLLPIFKMSQTIH